MDPSTLDVFNMSDRESISVKDIRLPYVVKCHTIFSPGTHNEMYYDKNIISTAYSTTSWDKRTRSLFLDHDDDKASKWLGFIENIKLRDDGFVLGDLELWDLETAIKLMGGAKFGVSPRVKGAADKNNIMKDFYFENFSIVMNPAVKTTYLNSQITKVDSKMTDTVPATTEVAKDKPVETPKVDVATVAMNDMAQKVLAKLESVEKELSTLKQPTVAPMSEAPKPEVKVDKTDILEKQLSEMKTQMEELKKIADKPQRSTLVTSVDMGQGKKVSQHEADVGMMNLLREMEGLPPIE